MGQTCTTVEHQTNRTTFGFESESQKKYTNKQTYVKDYLSRQRQTIKNLALIQNSGQLIYQFNDMTDTVEKLKVKNWMKEDCFEELCIQQFIDEMSFIVRAKIIHQQSYLWKVFSTVKVDNISSQNLMDFGLFYYNFSKIKHYHDINPFFIYTDKCSVKYHNEKKSKGTFIIESQQFQSDIVSLKKLGRFMKKNDICWQDKEFAHLILKCCKEIQKMHENNLLVFEQFLITQKGEIYCIGGLVEQNVQLSERAGEDFYLLGLYLIETLFGKAVDLSSVQDLLDWIRQEEETCKFEHEKSIAMLLNLIKKKQPLKLSWNAGPEIIQTLNISSYVQSYRIKTFIQPSLVLAQRYIDLKEYYKAKEILFQRLSILIYQQKGQLTQQGIKSQVFSNLLKKLNISKSQVQECFDVLEHIIRLERKIAAEGTKNNQLDGFVKEYINLGILLSFNSRKQENFMKSMSILERVHEFLGRDNDSWLLNMHLAECYLSAGKLDQAQTFYKTSIKFQINQASICFFIKFYATVLNWQKAISLLRSYEGLIIDQYIYDFMIAKIFLSKALCTSPTLKEDQDQRKQTFYQSLSIARRIFDRKSVPEILLCDSYELIGDGHFYLKEFEKAFEAYENALALARSIQYSTKNLENNIQNAKYEPTYIQKNQLDYSRSITSHIVQNTQYKRSSTQKSAGNQTFMSVDSLVSQTQEKQASFTYQLRLLHNFDKKAILLSSMANCRFMKKQYSEAIKLYQQARNAVLSHNLDLKNSIVGNMAICSISMGKNDQGQVDKTKVKEGKELLEHILNATKKETPSKLQSDVNYMFLLNEFEAQ